MLPEWLVATEPDTAIGEVVRAVREHGLLGLQFLPPQFNLYGQRAPWDGPGFRPFWPN